LSDVSQAALTRRTSVLPSWQDWRNSRDGVIGRSGPAHQIQGDGGELKRGTAVHEENFMGVRNI
jgi:hypothetical protein